MQALDYAKPTENDLRLRPYRLLAWGLLPSFVLLVTVVDNIVTGDPVDSVTRFTAYHYMSAVIVLLLLIWLGIIWRKCPHESRPTAMFIAVDWSLIHVYWVYLFIDDVRTDPASSYYFSIWRPFGWLGL